MPDDELLGFSGWPAGVTGFSESLGFTLGVGY